MFDNGTHVVLRRDGVCVVLKAPVDEMPQVEYWGRDFDVPDTEDALKMLDVMTLKVTTPDEKPDAALRPSILPQGAEVFAGRPGLEAYRGNAPVFVRWTSVTTKGDEHTLDVRAEDSVNDVALYMRLTLAEGGLLLAAATVANAREDGEPLVVDWLDMTMPVPRRADHLAQFAGRWPLEKQPATTALPVGSVTRDCRHGKTGHESPWMFIVSDGAPKFACGEVWTCHLAWSGNQTYRIDNLPQHEALLGAGELPGPGEMHLAPGETYTTPQVCFSYSDGASTAPHPASTAGCARCRSMCAAAVLSRSTHGRSSTSTMTRRRSSNSPTSPRTSASNVSCPTTAGSICAATTRRGSATGSSTRRCGRTGSTRSRSMCMGWACSSACGSSRR